MRFLVCLLLLLGCYDLKYQPDTYFMGSALANSPEFLVKVNGTVCKDADNQIGACYKRISSSQDLQLDILPLDYAYTFHLTCTDTISSDVKKDVLANQPLSITIPSSKYGTVKVFNCVGRVFPLNRREDISAFFEVRVRLVDSQYTKLEDIYKTKYKDKDVMIFGKYAYKTQTMDNGMWKQLDKVTVGKPHSAVIVESYNMRYSYYGL
jgi:hypothetical protein